MISSFPKFHIDKPPLRTGAMAMYPYDPVLEERMTFYSRFAEEVKLSVRKGGALYLPRNFCPVGEHDDRVSNPIDAIDCKIGPRSEEQAACIAKSIDLLRQGRNHVLEAPTGWGKTYGGSAVAAALGQTTLIVVPKNDLMHDWKDTLIDLIGVPPGRIGHIQQNVCDYQGKWFTLAMLHSLVIADKYPPEMLKYFGCVLFDETHRVAADTFQLACQMFPAKYRLGLSATPKRDDGKDPVIVGNIGEVLVKGIEVPMKPKILVKKTKWAIPVWNRWNKEKGEYVKIKMPHAPGRMAGVYKIMAADAARNKIIAEFVKTAYDAERTVVVMSDALEHLQFLFQAITKVGIPGEQVGYYVGGMKKPALKANAARRVILCTYKMAAEGTNFPDWDTLVPATPRAKIKQPIGRVMRWKQDKKQPVILDLVDVDALFGSFYKSREVEYYSVGAEIVKMGS